MNLKYVLAGSSDGEELAKIRVAVMRESLEAIGRFDPVRARNRFLTNFDPQRTWKIIRGGNLIGFYVLLLKQDHFYLDHLYIDNAEQGRGIGHQVIDHIKLLAHTHNLPIRLRAVIKSQANAFYVKNGFTETGREQFDIHYEFAK